MQLTKLPLLFTIKLSCTIILAVSLNPCFGFLYIFIAIKGKELTADILHTDHELLRLIALDNENAYRAFFQRYFERLFSVMLQYTGRRPDAEDIVQSVFLKVWEKRKQLPEVTNPESWLFITARNEFINRFRKSRTEQQYRDYLGETFEEAQTAPDELLMLRQRNSIIRKALLSLPEKQQQAFLLSREHGLTYEKIAERMGVARTTVKEHISRAMKSMRDFMLSNESELLVISGIIIFF